MKKLFVLFIVLFGFLIMFSVAGIASPSEAEERSTMISESRSICFDAENREVVVTVLKEPYFVSEDSVLAKNYTEIDSDCHAFSLASSSANISNSTHKLRGQRILVE